ncbi:hypothetical protein FB451DRAFT_1416143 [Mycena latifolia]|nr:hypothetical protein FB451DRAFT_1416143 [Mycena latifolia]
MQQYLTPSSGHQLGISIAVLRQYHALGVRYVTLTHTCHNPFADSCGTASRRPPGLSPSTAGSGEFPNPHDPSQSAIFPLSLSPLGLRLIDEVNRLRVLVDLLHTSMTPRGRRSSTPKHSKASVIWSHCAKLDGHTMTASVCPPPVSMSASTSSGTFRGTLCTARADVAFVASPGNATVYAVADRVEHIAKVAGKKYVGLGSDYDAPRWVLEDVSKYPALFAELYTRGWNKDELAGLTGANLLCVFEGAEKVSRELKAANTLPVFDLYDKRSDMLYAMGI